MSEELRIDIKSMTLPELTALMKDWGEPGFRAGQLFRSEEHTSELQSR